MGHGKDAESRRLGRIKKGIITADYGLGWAGLFGLGGYLRVMITTPANGVITNLQLRK